MEVIKCRNDTLSLLIMFHLMFIKLGIMLGFSAYAHSSPFTEEKMESLKSR